MNRIILIGNGFDLAHGMKTSYKDFINDYWLKATIYLGREVKSNPSTIPTKFEMDELSIDNVPGVWLHGDWVRADSYKSLTNLLNLKGLQVQFKNKFLEILTSLHTNHDWVDIENEYYKLLKQSISDKHGYNIKVLNEELTQITNRLSAYLAEEENRFSVTVKNRTNYETFFQALGDKIYSPFKIKDLSEGAINRMAEVEFRVIKEEIDQNRRVHPSVGRLSFKAERVALLLNNEFTLGNFRDFLLSEKASGIIDMMPEEILFLNFNYTSIEQLHQRNVPLNDTVNGPRVKNSTIHIHGTTSPNDHNNVIFGFGDEIDEDYKAIENLNDNNYLENIKSIKYLETDNYKQLLEFLNSSEYQVFIFGHSCGISDRTLLNTIFEHSNCSSIKPFYHKLPNGEDNYSDIVRNISRNFNSKVKMRDRVVNKQYCEPLSEISLLE